MRRNHAIACVLFLCLIFQTAYAEKFQGTTVASTYTPVTAVVSGILTEVAAEEGMWVNTGDILTRSETTPVFAPVDGIVSNIRTKAGAKSGGIVLDIRPLSKYTVQCTFIGHSVGSWDTHYRIGLQVYVSCQNGGAHRGIGRIISLSGTQYTVEMLQGELFAGEAVNIYRSSSMRSSECIGVGTVISAEAVSVSADGWIHEMLPKNQSVICRGEKLFTYADNPVLETIAPLDGILTNVKVETGSSVKKDDVIAAIVSPDDIALEMYVKKNQTENLYLGKEITYIRSCDEDTTLTGTISAISSIQNDDGLYRVTIHPDEPEHLLGLTVEITAE